ncbi:Rho guanine nucleotide exchange factor scd1 [Smittium mucronatum]|uniref:Rho guanine nucleotide exchange factor scd1 n=1 Tax=Smittium mucronatum TaxID=133383 RepID=A0A1R0GZB4_9FUNG|nr:Rho guanine nucleotide exchange factor scd1 [Smittium mucronatum]
MSTQDFSKLSLGGSSNGYSNSHISPSLSPGSQNPLENSPNSNVAGHNSISTDPTSTVVSNKPCKIKVHFGDDIYVLVVKPDIPFKDLRSKVEKKIKLCAAPDLMLTSDGNNSSNSNLGIKIRYRDEDGDLILVSGQDDLLIAFESAVSPSTSKRTDMVGGAGMKTLNLFITMH